MLQAALNIPDIVRLKALDDGRRFNNGIIFASASSNPSLAKIIEPPRVYLIFCVDGKAVIGATGNSLDFAFR